MRSHRTRAQVACAPPPGGRRARLAALPAVAVLAALAVVPAAAAANAPAAEPRAAGPSSAAARVVVGGEAAGGAPTFPPCIDVEFEAAPVTGRPPITLTWLSDTGEVLAGNPVVIDTADYPAGAHQLTVTAASAWGSAQAVAPFEVETLAAGLPVAVVNPAPGLVATVGGAAAGYTEWRFVWGDGQATPWQPACVAETSHTYAAAGTYPVRLEARNCLEAPVSSETLLVTVGGSNLLVTAFQVLGCQYGQCVFTAGTPLAFFQSFTLPPALYSYDWDGDGTADEISGVPVAVHVYDEPGSYRPAVTATWGSTEATRIHTPWIHVTGELQPFVFHDGFEGGDAACWSAISGVPQGPPGPGCFAP